MVRIGMYEYDEDAKLGSGSEGEVYKGINTETGEDIVVKADFPCEINRGRYTQQIQLLELLKQATKASENLVTLHEVESSAGRFFTLSCLFMSQVVSFKYVLEYCNQGDLDTYLSNNRGVLDMPVLRHFFKQIAAAMKVLYDHRVVQRDMKPANILLHDPLGRKDPPALELVVKVSDYGFSRILDSNGLLRTWCGTPRYFAPEVWFHPDFSVNVHADAANYRYKAKIDLYSVGVIIYECYVGRHPFLPAIHNDIRKLRKFYRESTQERMDSVASLPSSCPASLRNLVRGLLVKDVHQRIDFDGFVSHPFFTESG